MEPKFQFFPINVSYQQKVKGGNHSLRILVTSVLWVLLLLGAFIIYGSQKFVSFFGSTPGLILMLIVANIIGSFIFNYCGMRVNKIIRLVKERKLHEKTSMNDLWKINNVKDKLTYCLDTSVKVFIMCPRGYTINRREGFRDIHNYSVAKYLGHLLKLGYTVDYHNITIQDGNTENLKFMENQLRRCPSQFAREIGNAYLQKYRSIESPRSATPFDFYIISTTDPSMVVHMMDNINTALMEISDSLYVGITILDNNSIIKFAGEDLLKLKGININELREQQVIDNDYIAGRIIAFITEDDQLIDGPELLASLENTTVEKEDNKVNLFTSSDDLNISYDDFQNILSGDFSVLEKEKPVVMLMTPESSAPIPMTPEPKASLEKSEAVPDIDKEIKDRMKRLLDDANSQTNENPYVSSDFYGDDEDEI